MRLKIVVQEPALAARTRSEWHALLAAVRQTGRRILQFACGLRGHDYIMKAQRRRLALHCPVCGHETAGWDLSDPTPKLTASDRPRYLELLRKRG